MSRGFEPLSRNRSKGGKELPFECVEALLRLLSIPLRSMGLGVLSLTEYVDLMYFLPWESQKRVRGVHVKWIMSFYGMDVCCFGRGLFVLFSILVFSCFDHFVCCEIWGFPKYFSPVIRFFLSFVLPRGCWFYLSQGRRGH